MTDIFTAGLGPFAGIATPSFLATEDRVRFNTAIDLLINTIPDTTGIATTYTPDADMIPPSVAARIRRELTQWKVGFNCTAVLTSTASL